MPHDKPNIILLQDDQHRWNALGCVNPLVKTPAIDRLAADGVRDEQAVCQAPACVPSRYSLMLGLYPSQIGVRRNGQWLSDERMPLPTLAEHLRDAGYQTAGFGKTHWSAQGCSTRGFETRVIGQHREKHPHLVERDATMMSDVNREGIEAYFRETEPYGGGEENVAGYVGRVSGVPTEDHRDGWVTQQCLNFLDSGQDDSRPLFLYLSFLCPHAAFNVPSGFEELYDIKDIPDMETPEWSEDTPLHTKGSDKRMSFFRDASPEVRRRTLLRYWANCIPGKYLSHGDIGFKTPGQRSHDVGCACKACDGKGRHVHDDDCEVFIILQGRGQMQVDSETHDLRAGDVVVCEPGEDHHLVADTDDPCVNIYLHGADVPHVRK